MGAARDLIARIVRYLAMSCSFDGREIGSTGVVGKRRLAVGTRNSSEQLSATDENPFAGMSSSEGARDTFAVAA